MIIGCLIYFLKKFHIAADTSIGVYETFINPIPREIFYEKGWNLCFYSNGDPYRRNITDLPSITTMFLLYYEDIVYQVKLYSHQLEKSGRQNPYVAHDIYIVTKKIERGLELLKKMQINLRI